jgi:two-component sensor histidine kinase
LVDEKGCHLFIRDDGVGLPEGKPWPAPGKMSALIVQSLRDNAKARVDVVSEPGKGLSVSIFFARRNAAP